MRVRAVKGWVASAAMVVCVLGGSLTVVAGVPGSEISVSDDLVAPLTDLQVRGEPDGSFVVEGHLGWLGDEADVSTSAVQLAVRLAETLLGDTLELKPLDVVRDELGTHVRMQQTSGGIPVLDTFVLLHATGRGEVVRIQASVVPSREIGEPAPLLAPATASSAALHQAGVFGDVRLGSSQLAYLRDEMGVMRLTWAVDAAFGEAPDYEHRLFFVDAADGALVADRDLVDRVLYRRIFDGRHLPEPPVVVYQEGGVAPIETAARGVYHNADYIYSYFYGTHRWSRWYGGGAVNMLVHWGDRWCQQAQFDVIQYNGSSQGFMSFCDNGGENEPSRYMGGSRDYFAHEYTHGINRATAGLKSDNSESGALNEMMSDVMAASFSAWMNGVSSNTFLIGDDCGFPQRQLDDPARWFVGIERYRDYYPEKAGHKYLDSTIGGLAFYLMSQGGTHPRGKTAINVPGMGISFAQKVFFKSLTSCLWSGSTFLAARSCTAGRAEELWGGRYGGIVHLAWNAVGVPPSSGGFETEPNNTTGTANSIAMRWRYGYLSSSADVDWYTFNEPSDRDLFIVFTPPPTGDFDVELYRGSALVASSRNVGNGVVETIEWPIDGRTGAHYVKVIYRGGSVSDFYAVNYYDSY